MEQPFSAELTVEAYLHGVRIDAFLVRHFRNYTPYRMMRLIRAGQVRIEGAVAETVDRVYRGQSVQVRLLEPPDHLLPAEPLPLEILFEDPWLIVVNKPPDLVVHPCGNYSGGSLANALQAHFDRQTQLRGLVRPGVVHRLDRLTSGVIVCTKEHLAHRRLSIHFQNGQVSKAYLALVHGSPSQDRGEIDFPIGQTPGGETIRMSVAEDAVDAKAARTKYTVLERFARFALVRAEPLTGRLHQIRVHLAGIGHPVLADEFYSPTAVLRESDLLARDNVASSPPAVGNALCGVPRATLDEMTPVADRGTPQRAFPTDPIVLARQALHAESLTFAHPILRDTMTFEAPLPPDMSRALELLRGDPESGTERLERIPACIPVTP